MEIIFLKNHFQGEAGEEEELDEEEEREEEEGLGKVVKEVGPPLLTPLSEDAVVDTITPWTATQSSRILADLAVALIRSNIWPGAFAFASGRCVHSGSCSIMIFH